MEDGYSPALVKNGQERFVVLSGCSGSGKSSLLAELGRRGFRVAEEAGRQIVKEQLSIGGDALPWSSPAKFVELIVSRSMHQMISAARDSTRIFFDRGIVDAVSFLEHLHLPVPAHLANALHTYRYNDQVFMTPPWRTVFRNDEERRHSFDESAENYASLVGTYQRLSYDVIEVPREAIAARADFILERLS